MVNSETLDIELFTNATVITSIHNYRTALFEYIYRNVFLHREGEVLEFGVYKGGTIRALASIFNQQKIYGFDSFKGLPEPWFKQKAVKESKVKHKKGVFAVSRLPKVPNNVELVKGFFDKSLPEWLINNKIDKIKLLHIDSDLYSSAKFILTTLNDYIVPGTVIIFDELYPWGNYAIYDLWEEGEWKALKEWTQEYNRTFNILARTEYEQAAIQII